MDPGGFADHQGSLAGSGEHLPPLSQAKPKRPDLGTIDVDPQIGHHQGSQEHLDQEPI